MSFNLVAISFTAIIFPAIASPFKMQDVSKLNRAFLLLIWIWLVTDTLHLTCGTHTMWFVSSMTFTSFLNINSIAPFSQVACYSGIQGHISLFVFLWTAEFIYLLNTNDYLISYFFSVYAFIFSFMSINKITSLVANELNDIAKHHQFL